MVSAKRPTKETWRLRPHLLRCTIMAEEFHRRKVFAYQWATISTSNTLLPDPPTVAPYKRCSIRRSTAELAPAEIAEAEKLAKQWEARAEERKPKHPVNAWVTLYKSGLRSVEVFQAQAD